MSDHILFVLILPNNKSEVYLDLTDRVHNPRIPGDERGLLGFTFSPDYEISKSFYVNYVNKENETIISRFNFHNDNVKLIDSENILLKFKQPFSNHNGGMLAFGPNDGYLYIGVGDGGYAGDPHKNSQNLNTIFGSILRIDIDQSLPYNIPKDNPYYDDIMSDIKSFFEIDWN